MASGSIFSSMNVLSRNEFIDRVLFDHHVPLDMWGKDAGFKIDRLYVEYLDGRKQFLTGPDNRLVISTIYTTLTVYFGDLILFEQGRLYSNGNVFARPSHETVRALIARNRLAIGPITDWISRTIIRENGEFELAFRVAGKKSSPIVIHPIYPGVWMSDTVFIHEWDLPLGFYKENGYFIGDENVAIAYEWMRIDDDLLIA